MRASGKDVPCKTVVVEVIVLQLSLKRTSQVERKEKSDWLFIWSAEQRISDNLNGHFSNFPFFHLLPSPSTNYPPLHGLCFSSSTTATD